MTRFLTPEQVLFLHSRMIAETGGEHGIRDLSMLLSALGRPLATFEGHGLYTGLFSKAAALMDSLIRNHAFVDGNKRTGIGAAAIFLRLNGYRLAVDDQEIVSFTLACAQSEHSLEEIAAWLEKHSLQG